MTLENLQTLARRLTNTTTAEYSNANLNASLTSWAHLLTSEVLDAMDDWDFQGDIATTTLSNKNEYSLPVDILKLKRIELSYDGTNWVEASIFDINQKGSAITGKESSDFSEDTPYVEIYENSIFIYPTPTSSVAAGLKIWYSKEVVGVNDAGADIDEFATSTDKPNIREAFQKGLSYGAAKDYFIQFKDWESVKMMSEEIEKIIFRMRTFYGNRIQDRKVVMQSYSSLENYE